MDNPMLEAALAYAERGWSIIPVAPGESKKPLVTWVEYQERCPSAREIRAWWKKWPHANIGVVTGEVSGLVVIDVDTRKGGEFEDILEFAPTELVSITGSGGRHLFYAYPQGSDGIYNRAALRVGVDVRGDGGYAVLPPSVHHSGNEYAWDVDADAGSIPQPMLASLTASHERESEQDDPTWISTLLAEGAEEGKRNDSVTRLAGYFASKGVPRDVAILLIQEWNDSKNEDPLPRKEIVTTVRSAYRTEMRKNPERMKVHLIEDGEAADGKKPKLGLQRLSDYMVEHGDAKVTWCVDGWLPNGTIAFLVAAPESYKTWFLLDLAVSVASAKPFLGMYNVPVAGPVLVFQQEDFHGGLAERLGVINYAKHELHIEAKEDEYSFGLPPELPIYIHPDRNLRFADVGAMDELEAAISSIRPSLVLIDPLYAAADNDDFMAKAVQDMFRLKSMRDKYGTTFVIAHHTKKGTSGATAREDGWGSQFLNAFLETGWQIRRVMEMPNTVIVRRHFKVSQSKEETHLKFTINTESEPFEYKVAEAVPDGEEKASAIVNLLLAAGKPMTPTEIAKEMGLERTTVSRKLKALEADGMVTKGPKGFHLPDTNTTF